MPERLIIVAQSENRVIGRDNVMPWHLPRDLRHFRRETLGHPVIMGRNTYASIGRALPGRDNLVISNSIGALPDAQVFPGLHEALAGARGDKVFIIGGAQIYAQAMAENLADGLLVTWVHAEVDGTHHFPEIDDTRWQLAGSERFAADGENAFAMTFARYVRK